MKCRECDFEGTWDEVDDHFVDRIRIGDPDHAHMPWGPYPPNLPDDFAGQRVSWGACLHVSGQTIHLAGGGFATYCRDCHTCVDWPWPPECTCGRGDYSDTDFEGNSLHRTDCPHYTEPLSNNPEWAADIALRKRRLADPEWAKRERREHLERMRKIDGKSVMIHLNGDEITVRVDGEIVDPNQLAQEWGDCKCGDTIAPPLGVLGGPLSAAGLAYPPSESHRTDCPRYRRHDPRKCSALNCDFEGRTLEEVEDHRNLVTRTAHWTDPASVIVANDHGHLVAEPCEECGNMISTGRNPHTGRSWVCSDHTETCSLHPRNVPRPPGVHFVEGSLGVDGKSRTWIDGVEQHPSRPYPHPEPKFWDDCKCDMSDRRPGSHHQVNCPRYRRP